MILAVFDCMIYFQAANNRKGAAGACLTLAEEGQVKVFRSPAILEEVTDIFNRPTIRASFPQLTDEHVRTFLVEMQDLAEIADGAPLIFRLSRDPDDEPYLNLAIAKHPSFLVTWDKYLLELMDDENFRNQFPDVRILNPPAFLAHVRAGIVKADEGAGG